MAPKPTTLADRLERYIQLKDLRKREPDPFQILNVKRTEAPYTHFIGWLLDPHAAHPWGCEFLVAILKQAKQPLPPSGPIEFFVESFSFDKSATDEGGFTDPDIFAVAPDRLSPTWCLVIENKFDSKEGRASAKATQCATYERRARSQFKDVECAFLFTTKTGVRAAGETSFSSLSYPNIASVVARIREKFVAKDRWSRDGEERPDGYAFYLVDAFLRHLNLVIPDDDVRAALRMIARGERPIGVSQSWLQQRPSIRQAAEEQDRFLDQWNLESMISQIVSQGASNREVTALKTIFDWGEENGICEFQASATSSFVVKIPTSDADVQILAVQGPRLKFYWGHFVGGYDETARPNPNSMKFHHAHELAQRFCEEMNEAFNWDLSVLKDGDKFGFCEPSKPLSDVASPERLSQFLEILSSTATAALKAT